MRVETFAVRLPQRVLTPVGAEETRRNVAEAVNQTPRD